MRLLLKQKMLLFDLLSYSISLALQFQILIAVIFIPLRKMLCLTIKILPNLGDG